jgi:hypothetical protein
VNMLSELPSLPSLGSKASQTCQDQSGCDDRLFGTSISIANATPSLSFLGANRRLYDTLSFGHDNG